MGRLACTGHPLADWLENLAFTKIGDKKAKGTGVVFRCGYGLRECATSNSPGDQPFRLELAQRFDDCETRGAKSFSEFRVTGQFVNDTGIQHRTESLS